MNAISDQSNISFQNAIAIVLFFTAIFFLIMISRVMLSPLMIVVKEEMAFSHAEDRDHFQRGLIAAGLPE